MFPTPTAKVWIFEYTEPHARTERWHEQRQQFFDIGIRLPRYDEAGLMFCLGDDLQLANSTPLRVDPHYGQGFHWTRFGARHEQQQLVDPGQAMVKLSRANSRSNARWCDVLAQLKLDAPIYNEVNWLYPPGANSGLPYGIIFLSIWATYFNLIAAMFSFAPQGAAVMVILVLSLGAVILGVLTRK